MLKLNKKARIVLGGGILLILLAAMFFAYLQQGREQDRLSLELDAAKILLNKQAKFSNEEYPIQQQLLVDDLTQLEQQVNSAKTMLAQSIEAHTVASILLEIAQATAVGITEIQSTDVTVDEIDGVRFTVLLLKVRVSGEIPAITAFIHQFNERLPTVVKESLDINMEDGEALISLQIYTYEGELNG